MRRYRDFALCEDAVQEALAEAAGRWHERGVPEQPFGWLLTVAVRRRAELWRSETARRHREERAALLDPRNPEPAPDEDDSLAVLLLCCHPALSPPAQTSLTLRAVGRLTTAEIARGFLVPEATVAQRISRAKRTIERRGFSFPAPSDYAIADRLPAALQVLYLIFNEGYAASAGPALQRVDLTVEAIRLARGLHSRLPGDGEVAGLLALMLLTDARRPARTDAEGALIPLDRQDRARWDATLIAEGTALVDSALARAPVGPYQVQAAIAALHAAAPSHEQTDWRQIVALYGLLEQLAPGPMVTLSRIAASAMAEGPQQAIVALERARADPTLDVHHRTEAVHAHLLALAGHDAAARERFARAAQRTLNLAEQRYLQERARS